MLSLIDANYKFLYVNVSDTGVFPECSLTELSITGNTITKLYFKKWSYLFSYVFAYFSFDLVSAYVFNYFYIAIIPLLTRLYFLR